MGTIGTANRDTTTVEGSDKTNSLELKETTNTKAASIERRNTQRRGPTPMGHSPSDSEENLTGKGEIYVHTVISVNSDEAGGLQQQRQGTNWG